MPVDELIDAWEAAWSGRDPTAFDELCAADASYEDPLSGGPLIGAGELAGHAGRLWGAFPDVRVEATGARLTDGHYVAAPCRAAGTHRGDLEGLPATDRPVAVHCLCYCELRDGRLLRVRTFLDVYDAARQLGVLPSRGTVGEKALLMLRGFGLRARP